MADHRAAILEGAHAQLRALEVAQDRDRAAEFLSTARTLAMVSAWVAWSAWLMLTRKASAPARISLRIISGSRLAGPSVARIFTLRPRGSSLCGDVGLVTKIPSRWLVSYGWFPWQMRAQNPGINAMNMNVNESHGDPLDSLMTRMPQPPFAAWCAICGIATMRRTSI
jgi:hypothetical protein